MVGKDHPQLVENNKKGALNMMWPGWDKVSQQSMSLHPAWLVTGCVVWLSPQLGGEGDQWSVYSWYLEIFFHMFHLSRNSSFQVWSLFCMGRIGKNWEAWRVINFLKFEKQHARIWGSGDQPRFPLAPFMLVPWPKLEDCSCGVALLQISWDCPWDKLGLSWNSLKNRAASKIHLWVTMFINSPD